MFFTITTLDDNNVISIISHELNNFILKISYDGINWIDKTIQPLIKTDLTTGNDILFSQKSIDDTIYHSMLGIPKTDGEYIYGKNDNFALVIMMKHLLTDVEFKNMMNEIKHALDNLEYNLKTIEIGKILDRMGFPENWAQLANISRKVK